MTSPVAERHAGRPERALVRIVHHYGARPEFVVLGGLVPELLCATSDYQHAGTTDIDVQVDLEIAVGAVNTARLEQARSLGGESAGAASLRRPSPRSRPTAI